MKKPIVIILFMAGIVSAGVAQTVSLSGAQKVAKNFYFERINQYDSKPIEEIKITESFEIKTDEAVQYYAFNIDPKGYVIISGIRNVVPVLAYSFNSHYGENNQPSQFIAWMEQYKEQIIYANENGLSPTQNIEADWERLITDNPENLKALKGEKEVSPMLISTWDQGTFYNQMCPADPAGPGGHCLTGCVATAMGQLCYYFRWPITGTGSYTYQHPVYGTISANFEETTYDWNGMINSLEGQNLAVAEVISHMGVSVDMDYGPAGSGMWNHKAAYSLRTYFKYAPETEYLYRDSTNLDWDSVIVAHLDRNIPMYYAGWSVPNVNGHAFIIDGYQTEEFFHFNWGWGGSYDGYFYLDQLNPGGSNFNLAQELVINCYPDTANYNYPVYCSGPETLTSLNGTIDDGSGYIFNYEDNTNCSWLIDPQSIEDSVTKIVLEFIRFDTETGVDELIIYDGPDASSPVLGTFSGNNVPNEIESSGNKVFITFITNEEGNAPGWFLNYESVTPVWCNGMEVLTEPIGTISDGSGSFYYQNGSTCMWNIQPPNAETLTLSITDFVTEEVKDVVKIYDAGNNQLLATYSGSYSSGNLPEPVTSPSGKMMVTFSSNTTVQMQGWTASYSITTDMGEFTDNPYEVILYPNPFNDEITLYMNFSRVQDVIFSVTDFNGKVLKKEVITNEIGRINRTINLSELPSGVYLLKLNGIDGNAFRKLVKR
ncbi:MAG: C10 family peptidase [Bacteroidales bacterium]